MALFLFANNATTTIAAGITAAATSVTLAVGTGAQFPSPSAGQQFTLTFLDAATGLQTEIAYCTARSGDTLTIVRGQEGTNPRAWLAGDYASNDLTAGSMTGLATQLQLGFVPVQQGGGTAQAATKAYLGADSTIGYPRLQFGSTDFGFLLTALQYRSSYLPNVIAGPNSGYSQAAPNWANYIEVYLVGGGGGGSNCATISQGGAGGGAGALVWAVWAITPGDTMSFIVGAGGASQISGGSTAFYRNGTLYATASGGSGAYFQSTYFSAGAYGGTAVANVAPYLNIAVFNGGPGGDGQAGTQIIMVNGHGANGPFGGGGRAGDSGGVGGQAPGAGGGGAYGDGTTTTATGGSGHAGIALYRFIP